MVSSSYSSKPHNKALKRGRVGNEVNCLILPLYMIKPYALVAANTAQFL